MHALDAAVLQAFLDRRRLTPADLPPIRSLLFNGVDRAPATVGWVANMSAAFNATAVLDVSDLPSPAFGSCHDLCDALRRICPVARVAFLLNRSAWLPQNAFLTFLIDTQPCFDSTLPFCLRDFPSCIVSRLV